MLLNQRTPASISEHFTCLQMIPHEARTAAGVVAKLPKATAARLPPPLLPSWTWAKHFLSFEAKYRPQHVLALAATQILQAPSHPLYIKTRRRWTERLKNESNELWWNVQGARKAAWKPVLYSWFKRRIRNAFREELKARNLDEGCRPILEDKTVQAPALIRGSLTILVHNPDPAVNYETIRKDCGKLIELLFRNFPATAGDQKRPQKKRAPTTIIRAKRFQD
jgi:hypothetical protein